MNKRLMNFVMACCVVAATVSSGAAQATATGAAAAVDALLGVLPGSTRPPMTASNAVTGTKILYFQGGTESVDAVAEITSLGAVYTKTANAADLNVANMNNFDMVWIGATAVFSAYSGSCTNLINYVQGGGSLVIGQPNQLGSVPCLPANLTVPITDIFFTGTGHMIIQAANACPLVGLTNADLPGGPADQISRSAIGAGWSVLTADAVQPTVYAGMLSAPLGAGKILFGNFCLGAVCATPASQAFLDKFVNCVKKGSSNPGCVITLNKTTFVNGDQVIAQVLRIANPAATPLAIEFKFWFEVPGMAPLSFARGGADGSVVLPAGLNQNLGPLPLFTVTSAFPRGTYAFDCRFVEPVTGGLLSETLAPFTIP